MAKLSSTVGEVTAIAQTRISIVIPAFNAQKELALALQSLAKSTCAPYECIVVDDCSTDESVAVAREHGAIVINMPKRSGPAAARNRGASLATGEILFFLDADVCVHRDTLQRVETSFQADDSLAALIGSYDDDPLSQDFLSQYRNLMHHYVHQAGREVASTFWSGCGAIRRPVFESLSGFDETYSRPAIEDIELGYRLFQTGSKVLLDHDLAVQHLKRWTFWGLVKTDVLYRGIPWTELILRDKHMPNDLNLQLSQRVSVALAFVLVAMAAGASLYWQGYFLTPMFALLFFVLVRFWGDAARIRSKAVPFWLGGITLAIIAMAARYHMFGLIPPLILSQILLLSRHRYTGATPKSRGLMRVTTVLYVLLSVLACVYYLPNHVLMFVGLLVFLVLGFLNGEFYLFLASKRGILFAIAAIPFHMLYHFYNGISFLAGTLNYWMRPRTPAKSAESPVEPVNGRK